MSVARPRRGLLDAHRGCLLLILALASAAALGAPETDIVVFHNGDRLTGSLIARLDGCVTAGYDYTMSRQTPGASSRIASSTRGLFPSTATNELGLELAEAGRWIEVRVGERGAQSSHDCWSGLGTTTILSEKRQQHTAQR